LLLWSGILGHIVTPNNIKGNTEAVKEFLVSTILEELCQFLGLTSHYQMFVKGFAQITQPLYVLTREGCVLPLDCESSFEHLKACLIITPVLACPNFDKDFNL